VATKHFFYMVFKLP